jgi:hypothetical protein
MSAEAVLGYGGAVRASRGTEEVAFWFQPVNLLQARLPFIECTKGQDPRILLSSSRDKQTGQPMKWFPIRPDSATIQSGPKCFQL